MCFKERKKPAVIVGIFSGLTLLLGLLMVALSINFSQVKGLDFQQGLASGGFDFKDEAVIFLLFISICTVLIGICGLMQMCCRDRRCTVFFGCTLFPFMLAMVIFGFTLALFSNSSMTLVEEYCESGTGTQMQNAAAAESRDLVETMDTVVSELMSEKMCSSICPCPDTATKDYWYSIDEIALNAFGRTKKDFAQDLVPLDFSGQGQKLYTNFTECLTDIIKGETSEARSEVLRYEEMMQEGII